MGVLARVILFLVLINVHAVQSSEEGRNHAVQQSSHVQQDNIADNLRLRRAIDGTRHSSNSTDSTNSTSAVTVGYEPTRSQTPPQAVDDLLTDGSGYQESTQSMTELEGIPTDNTDKEIHPTDSGTRTTTGTEYIKPLTQTETHGQRLTTKKVLNQPTQTPTQTIKESTGHHQSSQTADENGQPGQTTETDGSVSSNGMAEGQNSSEDCKDGDCSKSASIDNGVVVGLIIVSVILVILLAFIGIMFMWYIRSHSSDNSNSTDGIEKPAEVTKHAEATSTKPLHLSKNTSCEITMEMEEIKSEELNDVETCVETRDKIYSKAKPDSYMALVAKFVVLYNGDVE